MPGVLDRPAVPNVLHQSLGAARPIFHHLLWGGHAPQRPGEISAAFAFTVSGLPRRLAAIGQVVHDQLGKLAATVFHCIPLRADWRLQGDGVTLLDVEEKGGCHAAHRPAPTSR